MDDMALRTLLDRVDDFQRRNPRFTISAPYCNLSDKWEVRSADGTSLWDNGYRMMTHLEAAYPECS